MDTEEFISCNIESVKNSNLSSYDQDSDNDESVEFDNKHIHGSNLNSAHDSGDDRVEKSRERNREHAKKTRLRKKVMLENLKSRLLELQAEAARLQQALEESNTANILLCLGAKRDSTSDSAGTSDESSSSSSSGTSEANPAAVSKGNIIDQLRSIVRAEAAIFLKPKFESALSASSSTVATNPLPNDFDENTQSDDDLEVGSVGGSKTWKNGALVSGDKSGQSADLDAVRKERNRMHAKLTRDRKKMFTTRLQQLIHSLEHQNMALRSRLQMMMSKNAAESSSSSPNPPTVPTAAAMISQPQYPPIANIPQLMLSQSIQRLTTNGELGMPLRALPLPPGFAINPALTMAPAININAYAPLTLKRKAYESIQDNSQQYYQHLQQQHQHQHYLQHQHNQQGYYP